MIFTFMIELDNVRTHDQKKVEVDENGNILNIIFNKCILSFFSYGFKLIIILCPSLGGFVIQNK